MAEPPSSEIVAVAWLRTLPGIPPNGVATTLPGDTSTWHDTGFVTVHLTGGDPGLHVPQRAPVLQLDCWAANPNSQKPPWGRANALAERIVDACRPAQQRRLMGRIALPAPYQDARVQTANVETEPRRVYPDEARFADYMLELALYWVPVAA
ncbi:hypothetical protein [Actinomadura sp. K4S16]|uniref:hypothetical protein n=1 Tax=Actinomadura sp. K4S16 TaxID=1316147 RepID=UPI0011EF82A0|nr:hypothetical protein [Actinomadura sp. K4S16]